MMKKEDFDYFANLYSPVIKNLIESNRKFYRFNETIKWCFGYDEDIAIMGSCDRNTNIVTLNLKSVIHAISNNDIRTIEYYLLHEIRHVFQHIIIKDYNNSQEIPINEEIVKKWIFEGNHYIKSIDSKGEENPEYFMQDSEMDAYAFSLSVMKYKYGDIDLYVPKVYKEEFFAIIDEWIEAFTLEKI